MKKKLVSVLAAMAIMATANGALLQVSAANTTDAEISVADVVSGAGIDLELGEIADNGDGTKTVNVIAKYKGFDYITSATVIIDFPTSLGLVAANCKNTPVLTGGAYVNDRIAEGQIAYSWGAGEATQSVGNVITKFTLTVPSDAPDFDITLNSKSALGFVDTIDWTGEFEGDTFDSKVTVPGSKTVDPQEVTANLVHRHDEANATDSAVEYYMADFTPADGAFNKLKVTLTRKDNTTVEQSQDFAVVTGKASVFVQVLVTGLPKGEEDAVKSVVVTASVE